MKNKFLIFLFSVSQFGCAGGHSVGNGGDAMAILFKTEAESVVRKLEKLHLQCRENLGFSLEKLRETLDTARISSTDSKLKLRKMTVDAINYPEERQIVFNRRSWEESPFKAQFALHEFLGLVGVDDSQYKLSDTALRMIRSQTCENEVVINMVQRIGKPMGKTTCQYNPAFLTDFESAIAQMKDHVYANLTDPYSLRANASLPIQITIRPAGFDVFAPVDQYPFRKPLETCPPMPKVKVLTYKQTFDVAFRSIGGKNCSAVFDSYYYERYPDVEGTRGWKYTSDWGVNAVVSNLVCGGF